MSKKLTPQDLQKLEIGDRVTKITEGFGITSTSEKNIVTGKTAKILTVSVPNSIYEARKKDVIAMAKMMKLQSEEEIDILFGDNIPPSWDFDLSTGKEVCQFNPFKLTVYLVTE